MKRLSIKMILLFGVITFICSCNNNEICNDEVLLVSSLQAKSLQTKEYYQQNYPEAIWLNDSLFVPIEIKGFVDDEQIDSISVDTTNIITFAPEKLEEFKKSELNSPVMLVKKVVMPVLSKTNGTFSTDYPKIERKFFKGKGQFETKFGAYLVQFSNTGANIIGIKPWAQVLCNKHGYRLEVTISRYPLNTATGGYDKSIFVEITPADSPNAGVVDPIVYEGGVPSVVRGCDSDVVTSGDTQTLKMTTYLLACDRYSHGGRINKWYPLDPKEIIYNYSIITNKK